MKKSLFLLILFSLVAFNSRAQSDRFKKNPKSGQEQKKEEAKPQNPSQAKKGETPLKDRIIYGGGAGLSFGNNTNIFLAPQVGYKVNDNWVVGAGYMYNYAKWNQIYTSQGFVNVDFENQVHGPNIFTNYSVRSFFVGTQFELLNHDVYRYNLNTLDFDIDNQWTPVLFLQGGFKQDVGRKGQMLIGLRLNVLDGGNSPYSTSWAPIFQIFF
ncbi:hypothetical protein [Croceimicrobium hydrocarbonivorans]|uniref:Outer membrane protein beta-barrel domain-containing protein n=1 Tax=Croceimicrobium hydrocarbonivorans TaxID=2761580 RepID=A0A7H0VID1_9FLAO|nr:hypothetical protein [Croceimicrobium hydrocarbonivorans]QNR25479.1 hypothetical protein H4K34_06460 [Croceimicrobium hydrocarbonivorans]